MLINLFCSPEEQVDFDIKIGLIPEYNRQSEINKIYTMANQILEEIYSIEN